MKEIVKVTDINGEVHETIDPELVYKKTGFVGSKSLWLVEWYPEGSYDSEQVWVSHKEFHRLLKQLEDPKYQFEI